MLKHFQCPDNANKNVQTKLFETLKNTKEFIKYFSNCEGLDRFYQYIKFLIGQLPKNVNDENARNWILERFDEFVIKKIIKSEDFIIDAGVELLKNTKTIMVYSFSNVIMKMLIEGYNQGHKFKVIIVDNPSNHYARDLVSTLTSKGIEVIYTLINSVAYFMRDVDKIFVGAYTMFSNGSLMATTGTSILASCAHQ